MCFSANASFGAAAVIGTVGLFTLRKVNSPSLVLFACIPLLFAVQQLSEGFVWLSLTNDEYASWKKAAAGAYLFFAQVVWPLLVPLSIYLIEKNTRRKKILASLTVTGALVAIILGWLLFSYNVTASVSTHHIDYTLHYPVNLAWATSAVYVMVTILPSFISGIKKMILPGVLVLTSFLFTVIFFPGHIISIWCYFAALISAVILYLVMDINKQAAVYKAS